MGCARADALVILEEVSQQKLHTPVSVQPTIAPEHLVVLAREGLREAGKLLWQMPASLAPISKRADCCYQVSLQGFKPRFRQNQARSNIKNKSPGKIYLAKAYILYELSRGGLPVTSPFWHPTDLYTELPYLNF